MSKLPDGYRVQDGCYNCKNASWYTNWYHGGYMTPNAQRVWPELLCHAKTPPCPTNEFGICPQYERREGV